MLIIALKCVNFVFLILLGFPHDVTFAEVSCVGQKTGLDQLRSKIKEKIDRSV